MQQLTEMDNVFVQMESTRSPMHISPVIFYDQSEVADGPVRFKQILEVFRHNLHKSAVFRRKLAGGALGLDTPYWIEDADFDLEFHVRHIALPKPGDWRQLCILLARLHAAARSWPRPLPHQRDSAWCARVAAEIAPLLDADDRPAVAAA